MRSFLRGSLYGVSATTGWIGPQQQPGGAQGAPNANFQGANQNQGQGAAGTPVVTNAATPNTAVRGVAHAMMANHHHHHHHASSTTSYNSGNNATTATATTTHPLHFATRATYGGFPIYGSNVSESETATIRAERSVQGKVSKWFDQRGFGFIEDNATQQQYFVHARDLITVEGGLKTLFPGQTVEFEPEQTENGGHALRVSGPGGAPLQSAPAVVSTTVSNTQSSSNITKSLPTAERHVLPTYTEALPSVVASTETETENNNMEQSAAAAFNLPLPRIVGTIAHWTADKGYGFVAVAGQDEHFFTHVKDFTCAKPNQSPSMPSSGMEVEFTPSFAGGKKRATHVTLPNSTPFQPNVMATPAPAPTAPAPTAQHHHHKSSLAMAFAIPEKKVQQQQQQVSASQQQQQPDPMWRAGYSSGFVDGQQWLKKEINNMPIAPAPSSSEQQPKTQTFKTVTVENTSNNNNFSQQQQSFRSRSPGEQKSQKRGMMMNNNNNNTSYNQQQRSSSNSSSSGRSFSTGRRTTSPNNNSSNNVDHWTENVSAPAVTTTTTKNNSQSPKWAQSAQSWASATTTTNSSSNSSSSSSSSIDAIPAASSTETSSPQQRTGGFPSFPQRGGFGASAFGRGRGHGGRGL